MALDVSPPPPDSQSPPQVATKVADEATPNPPEPPADLIRWPPFPTPPEGVHILPFKDFRQAGIEIFSEDGIERDGRGVPTISLRVRHDTDVCKTDTTRTDGKEPIVGKKKKKGKKKADSENNEGGDEPPAKIDHIQRARDKKLERIKQFAIRHWYEVWEDGEDLRGLKITYEPTLSTTDRIHMAATDFRTGRPWPHVRTQVAYLWDQIRLFSGLLGQTPVWIRTDLIDENAENTDSDDVDDEEEFEAELGRKRANVPKPPKMSDSDSDSEPAEEDDEDVMDPPAEEAEEEKGNKIPMRPKNPRKRIQPRTPYALYNVEPIRISSAEEVPPLLARASRAKAAHLAAFLFDPGPLIRTRILLSSHLRSEGLVYTPGFLRDLPRLLLFWIDYLLRTHALREVERELRSARDIARRAVDELIRTGVVCKRLPDRVGKGMKGFFGVRWRDEEQLVLPATVEDVDLEEKEKDEKVKQFEEALKAENVQFLDVKDLPPPPVELEPETLPIIVEEKVVKTSPAAYIEEADEDAIETPIEPVASVLPVDDVKPKTSTSSPEIISGDQPEVRTTETDSHPSYPSFTIPVHDSGPSDVHDWNASKDPQATLSSWLDAPTQQLFDIMGPTVLPLKFEAGGPGDGLGPWTWLVRPGIDDPIAKAASAPIPIRTTKRAFVEKSMRRVKSFHPPGVLSPAEKAVAGYVSKGVESEIVERLARIVLEPWLDWDSRGKVEPLWSKPRVQRPDEVAKEATEGEDDAPEEEAPLQHDPEKDEILLLVDPSVLETVFVGMGIAGTWVQLVRVPSTSLAPSSGPVRGRGGARGRGQGRGRGRGRGGAAGGGTQQRKQLTWWYVEDIYMAIPSYWFIGDEVIVPDEEDDSGT